MFRAIAVIVGGLCTIIGGSFACKDGYKAFKQAKAEGKTLDFND